MHDPIIASSCRLSVVIYIDCREFFLWQNNRRNIEERHMLAGRALDVSCCTVRTNSGPLENINVEERSRKTLTS